MSVEAPPTPVVPAGTRDVPQIQTTSLLALRPGRIARIRVATFAFAWRPYVIWISPPAWTVMPETYLPVDAPVTAIAPAAPPAAVLDVVGKAPFWA